MNHSLFVRLLHRGYAMLSCPEVWREFFEIYYRKEINKLAYRIASGDGTSRSLYVNLKDLGIFREGKLRDELLESPDVVINHAVKGLELAENIYGVPLTGCRVRFYNAPPYRRVLIRDLRSVHISKFVAIEGIVRKVTEVRPRIVKAVFICRTCGKKMEVPQDGTTIVQPYECRACKGKRFEFLPEESEAIDSQRVRIQEYPENLKGGEQPQSIDVVLEGDIAGTVKPGDRVIVNGILKPRPKTVGNRKTAHMDIYMEGNSVEILQQEYEELVITEEDKKKILELSRDPNLYDKIVRSIAPAIYGHEDVKLAIALQLFGGVPKKLPDGTEIRGDIHILLIGDPGTAKSQLLKYVHRIAPRSVYTSGKGTTTAGLCVAPNTEICVNGKILKIKEFVESFNLEEYREGIYISKPQGWNVKTANSSKIVYKPITSVWKIKAPETMVRIKTTSKSVEVTSETKILTKDGWKKAGDVEVGELIAVEGDRDIGWEEVKSKDITESPYEFVYDLTVEDSHSFIANGIVVHNTATVVRDEVDGRWTLEAGALVLADKGIALVDEIDKMRKEDRSALHEALEQQSISVSKAGITAVLKARCALLAAANPKYGRFNRYEPLVEQINLEPPLLSRFDLIFIVTDEPDEKRDELLARHVVDVHELGEKLELVKIGSSVVNPEVVEHQAEKIKPAIDPELLRKYVAYAKKTVFPVLTKEAKDRIVEFYKSLRAMAKSDEHASIPITARQLEAIIRLAEASARVRLSYEVTVEDVERAIRIFKRSLEQIAVDPETGKIDIDYAFTGTSATQRDRIAIIKKIIEELEKEHERGAPEEDIIRIAEEKGISKEKAEEILAKLKQKGEIYSPRYGYYRVVKYE